MGINILTSKHLTLLEPMLKTPCSAGEPLTFDKMSRLSAEPWVKGCDSGVLIDGHHVFNYQDSGNPPPRNGMK